MTHVRVVLRWYLKVLWIEDVHCPMVVSASSEDMIVPAVALKRHLEWHQGNARTRPSGAGNKGHSNSNNGQGESNGNGVSSSSSGPAIDLLYLEGVYHGEILARPAAIAQFDRRIRRQEEEKIKVADTAN
jgi:hypothetical protein